MAYEVDEEQESSAFHLYLLGSGSLEIPEELQNVISIHTGLEYLGTRPVPSFLM